MWMVRKSPAQSNTSPNIALWTAGHASDVQRGGLRGQALLGFVQRWESGDVHDQRPGSSVLVCKANIGDPPETRKSENFPEAKVTASACKARKARPLRSSSETLET